MTRHFNNSRIQCAGAGLLLLLFTSAGNAEAQGRTEEQLRRIFASRDFAGDRFGPARWLGDSAYTTVEQSATVQDAGEIVRYDAATGQRTVLIAANQLVPAGAREPLDIEDYAWSKDGSKL
jgi:dipeptidyl-peptidase-4